MKLTEEEKQRIQEAVRSAELKTSGEIVPMVLERSDDYPGARWRVAVAFALFVAFSFYFLFPDFSPEIYLWAQFPALVLGYGIGSITGIQRFFLSKVKMAEEVHQRALQAFHYEGLAATRDRTGVLIMVSLLEHQVEVLADSGISSKVDQKVWEQLVARLLERIKEGRFTDGMCEAISECGRLLSEKFPRSAADVNELSNNVVTED